MSYYTNKAKLAYELHSKGLPFRKTYAVVEKDGKFLVLTATKGKHKYMLAGGTIDNGEDVNTAVIREVMEELNVNVEVVKHLGTIKYQSNWNYEGNSFVMENVAEIMYTKFVGFSNNDKLGLDGEFDSDTQVALVSKEEMLNNVAEFVTFGVKLD